jgi:hypothetical protein
VNHKTEQLLCSALKERNGQEREILVYKTQGISRLASSG